MQSYKIKTFSLVFNKIKSALFFVIVVGLLFSYGQADAAARYWVGAAGANASVASNWASTSGGAGGAGVPGSNDDVYFDAGGNSTSTVDIINWSIKSMTIGPGFTKEVVVRATTSTTTISGDLVINSGILTHYVNSTGAAGEKYKLIMNIGGSLSVNSGGTIDVTGKGYVQNGLNVGQGYGGVGASGGATTYGSITDPSNIGSAYNSNSIAGGAVILDVTGASIINGSIKALSTNIISGGNGGTGGTIFIKTQSISGSTGVISANSGNSGVVGTVGSGGRVSIKLRGAGQDFSNYTGTITASAGSHTYGAPQSGAAGTVYKETKADADRCALIPATNCGTLIIDNNNAVTSSSPELTYTLINESLDLANFSSIIIRNKGHLAINTGDTFNTGTTNLTVTSSSTSMITALSGSSVVVSNDYNLSGYTLTMMDVATTTTAGNFTVGSTGALILGVNPLIVNGNFTIATGGYATHLYNTTAAVGEKYKFVLSTINGGNFVLNSGATIHATSRGYTANSQGPGAGSSTGSYGGLSSRAYVGTGGTTYGSITAPVNFGSTGANGASRPSGGAIILNISGSATINGAIRADSVGGSCMAYAAAGSVFITANSLADSSTGLISASGPSVTGNNCGAGGGGRVSVVLTGVGQTFPNYWTTAGKMVAYGGNVDSYNSSAAGTVYQETLAQGSGHGTLIIDNNNYASQIERVQTLMNGNIDLSQFSSIIVRNKGNLGINTGESLNLDSNNLAVVSSSTSFVTAMLGASITIPNNTTINDYTITLLSTPAATTTGNLNIGSGTLSLGTQPLGINGNLNISSGGTLTHNRNFTSALYRLVVNVLGDLNIDPGGSIDVSLKGYSNDVNNVAGPGGGTASASHGGLGSTAGAGTARSTYGSIIAPTQLGSSAAVNWAPGGGAAILNVSGSTIVNGSIRAIGHGLSACVTAGSGGSIFLTTDSLTGSSASVISANAGQSYQAGNCGSASGGGRVSLVLTGVGQDFSNYLGAVSAWGANGPAVAGTIYGAAGTVYKETFAQGSGHGTLIVDNYWGTPTTPSTDLGTQNTNALDGLTSLNILNNGKFIYYANSTSTFSFTSSPTIDTPTIAGATSSTFISFKPLIVPGTTAFYGTFSASSTSVTYTGFAGQNTTVVVLPGLYGSFITSNVTDGIVYQLSGNLVLMPQASYTIPCGVTIDLAGFDWHGNLDYSTNASCGARLVYNGGTLNDAGESGGLTTICSSTRTITGNTYDNYTVSGVSGTVCTLGGNVIVNSTMTVNNGATLNLNGFSLKTTNLNLSSGSTLQLQGGEDLTVTGTLTNNGTVKYVGNGNSVANTYFLKGFPSYKNLIVAFSDAIDSLVGYFTTSMNTGLVGYWKLDESTNTGANTVIDSSGNVNNGTPSNSPTVLSSGLPSPISFLNSSALSFNGSNQYLTINSSPSISFGPNKSLSVALWVKASAVSGTASLIHKGTTNTTAGSDYYIYKDAGSYNFSVGSAANSAVVSTAVPDTSWHHLVGTYQAINSTNGTVKIYMDGVLKSTSNGTAKTASSTNTLYIARDSGGYYFGGSMDDIRVYNRVLSQSEITTLASGGTLDERSANSSLTVSGTYNQTGGIFYAPQIMTVTGAHTQSGGVFVGSSTVNFSSNYTQTGGTFNAPTNLNLVGNYTQSGASSFVRNSNTLNLTGGSQTVSATTTMSSGNDSGLVGYWKFDEDGGTSAVDSSGLSNNGTYTSGAVRSSVTPLNISFTNPSSLYLDGVNDYVAGPLSNANLGVSSGTVSFWFKRGSLGPVGTMYMVSLCQTSDCLNNRLQVVMSSSRTIIGSGVASGGYNWGNSVLNYSQAAADLLWHHVVFVWDLTSGRLYFDGVLRDTEPTNPLALYLDKFNVGSYVPTPASYPFGGNIDDVKIYNRALTSNEISSLYEASSDSLNGGGAAFNNLSKTVYSAATLSFTGGYPVTVFGTSTFKGATGQLLTLGSTNSTQWKFDPRGGLDLANLVVNKSNNINASTTNRNPVIYANNFTNVTDGGVGGTNTNWVFIVNTPIITLAATGTQATTTPLPIGSGNYGGKYMGGAFYGSNSYGTSTVTSIRVTQRGTLPTSKISNVQLLYATSTNGLCSTSSTPVQTANAVEFGHTGTWVNGSATTTGTLSVGAIPMCIYTKFSLIGPLTAGLLGLTVDLEVTNPSTDIVASGATILPTTPVNVQGDAVQTFVTGQVSLAPSISLSIATTSISSISGGSTTLSWSVTGLDNTSSCEASGDWNGGKDIPSGSQSTGNLTEFRRYTYTLTCSNMYDSSSATVYVTLVDPRKPVTNVSAIPNSVAHFGDTSTLYWSVSYDPSYPPTGCTSSGPWGSPAPTFSGGSRLMVINTASTYSLSCGNSWGTTTSSLTLGLTPTVVDPCLTGQTSDVTCNEGVGTTPTISLINVDGTITKFFVMNGRLIKQVWSSDGSQQISAQVLTDPNLTITDSTFTRVGDNSLQVQLKVQKKAVNGSVQNYVLQKSFKTTATVRGR